MSVPTARTIMPRPEAPPTPSASLDITGKSGANAPQLETGFTLPPAALAGSRGSVASSSGTTENASDSSYRPPSPSSPVASAKPGHARKRSSTVITKDDYSLPPPPTRSRKIIQMKPKDAQEAPKAQFQTHNENTTTTATNAGGTKRKQANNNTAAGRKIARKTAHSLIERRRRSKMNEEFGVLKDMIPACRDQEMHKLAILQV
jgi:type II secretory pathway component GspD/PulD (secretin)